MQHCPFCGTPETDRFDLDGHRFLVFGCMFSPQIDPALGEEELAAALARAHPPGGGSSFFRGTCDRLHYFVTKGPGARALIEGTPDPAPSPPT
jgi:hypothetical protein